MRTRAAWLQQVLVVFGLTFFYTGTLLAQTQTQTTDVRNSEVLAVDGNNLVIRDQNGTQELTVPDNFRFSVDGKPMSVKESSPG